MGVSKTIRFIPISIAVMFAYFLILRLIDFRLIPNILVFLIGIIIFFITFILQMCVCGNSANASRTILPIRNTRIEDKLLCILGIILLYISWNWDEQTFINIKSVLIGGLTIISFILIVSMVNPIKRSKLFRLCLCGFVLIMYFYCLYEPNFILDAYGTVYHSDAYTTSIVNVANGFPYSFENVGIYGHYGILYLLPVKLLSIFFSQWTAIAIAIAMIGTLGLALMILTVNNLISNDILFAIATISLCFFSFYITYGGNYFQLDPHRYFFQAVCLFGCSAVLKYKRRLLSCLMWLISSLAIVWNLETGVVCLIVWTVCWLYFTASQNGWKVKYFLAAILGDVLSFVLSILIVDLYNFFLGGSAVSLLTFIYPLGYSFRSAKGGYNILGLSFSLSYPISIWFVFVTIMISVICLELLKFIKTAMTDKECVVFLSALMGIGVSGYYMNMPLTENKFIMVFSVIIVLSFVAEYGIEHVINTESGDNRNYLISYAWKMSLVVLLLVFWSSFSSMYGKIAKIEHSTHNDEQIDEFCSAISANIPQGTIFIGTGTSQLCAALNRRNGLSYMDFPDTNEYGLNYVKNMIQKEQYSYILLSLGTYENEIKESLDDYVMCNQFDYYDYNGDVRYTYVLYRRRNSV